MNNIDNSAFFKINYGLFVLTAKQDDKDNGCIINTVMQVTDTPKQIIFAINKQNLTHDMIIKTKSANISILSVDAPFSVFENFGFKSGRDTDKMSGIDYIIRANNGVFYLNKYTISVICLCLILLIITTFTKFNLPVMNLFSPYDAYMGENTTSIRRNV